MLGWRLPHPIEAVTVHSPPNALPAPSGPLRVVVWNVQYAAGRDRLFFYDGGDAVSVDRATVMRTLEAIRATLARLDPDVVLLQEVDRGSRRTAFVDQHAWLAEHLGLPCHGSATLHRVPYVPAPAHEHLGRVDMHLSTFSRYRLLPGTRVALPLLRESWVRQQFNLRRCLTEIPLDRIGGPPLLLLNTHLSAFSRGDGTLQRQVAAVTARLARADLQGSPWLLGGDFNALPPGDDPGRLGPDREQYGYTSPLGPLFARWPSAVTLRDHLDQPATWRTWVPFGSDHAERALDHAFGSVGCRFRDVVVDRSALGVSDHLPLAFTVEVERK